MRIDLWQVYAFGTLCLIVGLLAGGFFVSLVIGDKSRDAIENNTMKLSELAGKLNAIETTLGKIKTEVQALKDGLSDVELPAEAQAALDRLESLSKAIDDINPDA